MPRKVSAKWIRNASDRLAIERGCYFEASYGRRAIEFLEKFCRQSKGAKWAGQPLQLVAWQKDFVMRLLSWRLPDGRRRMKTWYLEVGKKNGKSTLLSGLALYFAIADGEPGAEVHINAYDRSQASIIYKEAANMIEQSPDLRSRFAVTQSKKLIEHPESKSEIRANSADVPSKDGANASHTIFDELHRQRDRTMWGIFEHAGAARDQPLRGAITTAGEAESGIWWDQRCYSAGVNDGTVPDIRHLGVVYCCDPGDDLDDPAVWRKANPSLGATIREDDFLDEWAKAKASSDPTELADFKRLRFGLVIAPTAAFLDLDSWDSCRGPIDERGIISKLQSYSLPAYMGIDLSSVDDLSSVAILGGDDARGYDLAVHFWLPEDSILDLEHRSKLPYRALAEAGYLTLTPGETVDYDAIEAWVLDQSTGLDLRGVYADQYNAYKIAVSLKERHGLPVEFLRQGTLSLNAPSKELLRLIKSRKVRHGGNPIMRNHVGNAVVERDAAGNIKVSKRKSRGKIDGVAATIDAVYGTLAPGDTEASIYESGGIMVLE